MAERLTRSGTALGQLAARAAALVVEGRRALLGIAGCPGAGKTSLARALVAALNGPAGGRPGWAVHVPLDGFHLADSELDRLGLRNRKGAPDTFDAGGYVALLHRLRDDAEDVTYAPAFERDLEQALAGAIPVDRTARLVVTEGNYLLLDDGPWKHVRGLLDEAWFCQSDDEIRTARLVDRHRGFGKAEADAARWVAEVDEPNAVLVRPTRALADLVVETTPPAPPA